MEIQCERKPDADRRDRERKEKKLIKKKTNMTRQLKRCFKEKW